MKQTKLTCDYCEKSLNADTSDWLYYLTLSSGIRPRVDDGMLSCGEGESDIDRDHHFCNAGCLAQWSKQFNEDGH